MGRRGEQGVVAPRLRAEVHLGRVQCLTSMLPSSRRSGKDTRTRALQLLMVRRMSGSTVEYFVALSKFSLTISKKRGSCSSSVTGPALGWERAPAGYEARVRMHKLYFLCCLRTGVGVQLSGGGLGPNACGKCSSCHWSGCAAR